MPRRWFKRKRYGWGWRPATWEGWLAVAAYAAAAVAAFLFADKGSYSASDTIIAFAPRLLVLTALFAALGYAAGEKPRWQWGGDSEARGGVSREKDSELSEALKRGGIAVIATDTTYGIVGSALRPETVERIYRVRKRDSDKPFIILIADKRDVLAFGCKPTPAQARILDRVWPGPVTAILPCAGEAFAYLHRGRHTLAFRLPAKESVRQLIVDAGPLVAPSANPQGMLPAMNVAEARGYFGAAVDIYADGGDVAASPSKLIDITDGTEKVLRA